MNCFSHEKHLEGCANAAYSGPFSLISSFSQEKHLEALINTYFQVITVFHSQNIL